MVKGKKNVVAKATKKTSSKPATSKKRRLEASESESDTPAIRKSTRPRKKTKKAQVIELELTDEEDPEVVIDEQEEQEEEGEEQDEEQEEQEGEGGIIPGDEDEQV